MALTLWILLAVVIAVGAAQAALGAVPRRRAAGLVAATGAVAGLLMLLGLDLAAVAWLAVGGSAALLAVTAGDGPDRDADRGSSGSAPPVARSSLLAPGIAAGLLFAILYRVILQLDWRPQPPADPAGQTAEAGGRLLTADAVLLVAAALLVTIAVAVAGDRGGHRSGNGGAP